jgi:hypothetical protein
MKAASIAVAVLAMIADVSALGGCDDGQSPPSTALSSTNTVDEASSAAVRAVELPRNSDEDDEQVALPPPRIRIDWGEWPPEATEPVYQDTNVATLLLTSQSETSLSLELLAGGDQGTTKGIQVDLGSVDLLPGEIVDVAVDLAPFLREEPSYSSSVGVRVRVRDLESDAFVEQVLSTSLYFHQEDDTLVLYDANALKQHFFSGDLEDGSRIVELEDLEDASIRRIVEWEPSGDELIMSAPDVTVSKTDAGHLASPGTLPSTPVYPHTLCAKINVETYDSGNLNSQGITEDIWPTADDGIAVVAYGMTVAVDTTVYVTSPSTGCVTFNHPNSAFVAAVSGFAYFTNTYGSYVRLHDGPSDTHDSYPGATHAYTVASVSFTSGSTRTVTFGDTTNPGESLFTGAAAFSTSLYRYGDGLPNGTEIHVSPAGACGAANYNYYNDYTNNEAYIRMQAPTCFGSNLSSKFTVAHEYGHALGNQAANTGISPEATDHSATPSSCPFSGMAIDYDNTTKEWSSIAFREGWAHFVSARVWNNAADDGLLTWGDEFDLERWSVANTPRGYLKNVCCPGSPGTGCPASLDGAGTIPDWMRGLWDLHTTTCGGAPGKYDMVALYSAIANSGGLTNDNFWAKSESAVASLFPNCVAHWADAGCHNGLDQEGGGNQYGNCP